jgi:hypothetical protein
MDPCAFHAQSGTFLTQGSAVNSDYEYQDHELLHRLVAEANLSVKCIAEKTNYSRGYVSEVRRTHLRREKAAKARAEEKQKMLDDYAAAAVAAEREACAQMVDHILKEGGGTYGDSIRARGQA